MVRVGLLAVMLLVRGFGWKQGDRQWSGGFCCAGSGVGLMLGSVSV